MNEMNGIGIEVTLEPNNFLIIAETLTRIGVASKKDKTLFQSCHILHKRGQYYILHFKELFKLDNKFCSLSENDLQRRNRIALLLEEWNLLKIVELNEVEDNLASISQIKVLSHTEKNDWNLKSKYKVGRKY